VQDHNNSISWRGDVVEPRREPRTWLESRGQNPSGTATAVATIAIIAVSANDLARRLSGTKEGGSALVMRSLEFAAAGLVLLFGYIAAKRVTCL
jgi:hypothetical protein